MSGVTLCRRGPACTTYGKYVGKGGKDGFCHACWRRMERELRARREQLRSEMKAEREKDESR